MKTWKATGCVLLAGIFWGSMGLFVRQLNAAGLYAIDVMQLRVLASAIGMKPDYERSKATGKIKKG